MGQFSEQLIQLVSRAASEQAGIISGDNPTHYNDKNPLRLWVIQVGIIILFTQLLSLILGRIRQPRVIAEVIGGILLGPSVMGRIPNFTNRIFPPLSIPLLSLTANIGLVFFLFLVGLEIDTRIIKRNAKASLAISAAGLILPFGLGAALAVPLYHEFINPDVNFGYFILFVAVAIGITAFPVLCRILTELRLLDTTVGVVTLAAGVGNDVVGWILLALVVTLVNASNGLIALYVLLAAIAYIILLVYPVRLGFRWLARKTGSLESGQPPSTMMMTITLLLVLVSALFTDIIGIHAIFGAFVVGLIIPHEGGFAIAMVEKMEDFIKLIFLPIYFTLSGLNTNLGLLNTGKTWGYTVLICVIAFVGKFVGCFFAAKLSGFNIRESGAIGSLMSCKGLVELIVLNVGLSAGILDVRSFSMFVLHALVLTFMTTPLVIAWYPPEHRIHHGPSIEKPRIGQITDPSGYAGDLFPWKSSLAVAFSKVEHLPALMSLVQLLRSNSSSTTSDDGSDSNLHEKEDYIAPTPPQLTVHALRLIELTERTSTVLRSQEASEPALVSQDPLLTVFRSFARLQRVIVRAALRVVSPDEFSQAVTTFANGGNAHMVVIPWTVPRSLSAASEDGSSSQAAPATSAFNPLESIFASGDRANFVRRVFAESPLDVALFVDRSSLVSVDHSLGGLDFAAFESGDKHHIFLPFFGGPDDRLALAFVVQICANSNNTATVVRFQRVEGAELIRDSVDESKVLAQGEHQTSLAQDTVYGNVTTQTRLASDTADNLLWARCIEPSDSQPTSIHRALDRITFRECSTPTPLRSMLELATSAFHGERGLSKVVHVRAAAPQDVPSSVFIVGRGRRMANEAHHVELRALAAEHGTGSAHAELAKTIGDAATAFIASKTNANLVVMQAAIARSDAV